MSFQLASDRRLTDCLGRRWAGEDCHTRHVACRSEVSEIIHDQSKWIFSFTCSSVLNACSAGKQWMERTSRTRLACCIAAAKAWRWSQSCSVLFKQKEGKWLVCNTSSPCRRLEQMSNIWLPFGCLPNVTAINRDSREDLVTVCVSFQPLLPSECSRLYQINKNLLM